MGCLCNYLQLSDDHDAMLEVGQPRGYSVGMDPGRFIAMCGGAFSRGLGGDPGVFVSEWEERGQKTEYFRTMFESDPCDGGNGKCAEDSLIGVDSRGDCHVVDYCRFCRCWLTKMRKMTSRFVVCYHR